MTEHDDVLNVLDAALQVEPSRRFADGVRARVNRSRMQTRRMWFGLAAAASVGLATVALWRPAVDAPVSAPVTPAPVSAPTMASAPPDRVAPGSATMSVPAAVQRVASAARPVTASSGPRLEVITNQPSLLRDLWAGVNAAAVVETVAEVAVPVPVAEVKPITPIVVEPIVVPPIVATEMGKDPGREGAVPIIRRMDAAKETK